MRIIIILRLVSILIIIGVILFAIEFLKIRKSNLLLEKAKELINQNQYEQGLNTCADMPYYASICHIHLYNTLVEKNQTISKEFCLSIPNKFKQPFWILNKEFYNQQIIKMRNRCTAIS